MTASPLHHYLPSPLPPHALRSSLFETPQRSTKILRFHSRPYVDEILSFCSESERRFRLAEAEAKTKADASARTARDGGRRRGGPRDSRSRGKLRQTDVVAIDPDTAVMSGSREAILRAAGAACLAVDEVRGLALRRVFVGWGAKYASQHISRRFVELLRVTLRFRNNAPTRGWQLFNGAASSSSGMQAYAATIWKKIYGQRITLVSSSPIPSTPSNF